jgi:hypothetical protein
VCLREWVCEKESEVGGVGESLVGGEGGVFVLEDLS